MRYLYMMIAVVCWCNLNAQEQPSIRNRADVHFNRYEYARAIPLFLQIADREDGANFSTLEKLAVSYAKTNDYKNAELWFEKAVGHEDHKIENVLDYARALKNNGKYSQAKEQFMAYSKLQGASYDVKNEMAGCDSALVWSQNPKPYQIINQAGINTERADFAAYPLNEKLYFVSEPARATQANTYGWTGESFLKVFEASLDQQNQGNSPQIWNAKINDFEYHVGPMATPDGGNSWYATVTFPGKTSETEKIGGRRYLTNRLALYVFSKNESGDYESVPFAYNNVEEFSIGHATFSEDGQALYFVSDMPGGQGQADIWYVRKNADGTWGQPINAGPKINTSQDELFPVIHGEKLFYSSNGLPGVGGLDVFVAKGAFADWADINNLGMPVNSAADDFAFVVSHEDENQTRGYLSSDRTGGKGSDDIYSFVYQKPAKPILLSVCGVTYDQVKKTPISATVELRDAQGKVIHRIITDPSGKFCFQLEPGISYELFGNKVKYHADSARLSTAGIVKSDTLSQDLFLDPVMAVGRTFVLENLYYDFDKHNIRPDAALVLDDLIQVLREYPSMKIELSSHTDSRGSDAYNMALSQRRAQAAVNYLVANGIAKDRLLAKGYGETKLVNACANGVKCSAADHQANRRTEFTVLELNEPE